MQSLSKMGSVVICPRPGKAIFSTCKGRVEIIMRIVAILFGSLPALISAAVALGEASKLGGFKDVSGSAGFVVAITSLSTLIETSMVVLRILNVVLINIIIKIIFTVVVVISIFVIFGGLLAGGVVTAIYGDDYYQGNTDLRQIGEALITSSFFCFLSVILYGMLIRWDLLFLRNQWKRNRDVVTD